MTAMMLTAVGNPHTARVGGQIRYSEKYDGGGAESSPGGATANRTARHVE